jgi:hypothetical protein
MTNNDCWVELEKIREELDRLMKREREIVKEWHATADIAKKRELEEEHKNLPILDTIHKHMGQAQKCFYHP